MGISDQLARDEVVKGIRAGSYGTQSPPLPKLFDKDGFDLTQAVLNNRFQGPSAGFFACLAIASAYRFSDQWIDATRSALQGTAALKIPGNGVYQPNVVRYSAKDFGTLYAVAGTTNLLQWIELVYPQLALPMSGVPGKVYQAFKEIADDGYAAILNDARLRPKSHPIALVGHSLGGALAELWAHKLVSLDGFGDVGTTTFGSPRFGDREYSNTKYSSVDLERVVNAGDVVPNVLPSVYGTVKNINTSAEDGFLQYYQHKKRRVMVWEETQYGREFQEDASVTQSLRDLARLTAGIGQLVARHSVASYGKNALSRSFLSDTGTNSPGWQRFAVNLGRNTFGF